MTRDTCGRSSPDAFAYFDPESSCWRTSQDTLLSDSTGCSVTLPKRGSMRSGWLYERPTWEPRTGALASSALLPTPAAQEPGGTAEAHLHRKNRLDGANRTTPTHLAFIEHLLPTPTANIVAEHVLLPTPTASDANASGGNTPSDVTVPDAVVRTSLGARTNPRLDDGNTFSEPELPGQLTIEDA